GGGRQENAGRPSRVGGRAERRGVPRARAGRIDRPVNEPEEVTPSELAALLESGEPVQLVDVRETWEVELAAIPGAMVLPLGRLPELVDALDPDVPIVAY